VGFDNAVGAIAVGIVLASAMIGYVLWRILLRPIRAMAARARDIKAGRADALKPLRHYGTAEMRDMGQAMLDMGGSLQNRAAGMRAYTDHVTHEMKSPLTSVIGAAELLAGDISAADRAEMIDSIRQSAARMEGQLAGLRALSAAREPVVDGAVLLSDAVAVVPGDVALVVVRDGVVPMAAAGLVAVLTQLAQNAAQHGARSVRIDWGDRRLHVQDNGRGIAKGNRARIFDPFFTTNRENGGSGLGLNIVRNMVEASGAEIVLAEVSTEVSAGATVEATGGAAFEIRF